MPKNFVGENFCAVFQKISGSGKLYVIQGGRVSRFSVENFLSHNAEKLRKGILLCCVSEKFPQRKRLWIRKAGIKIFRRKVFCLRLPKVSWGENSSLCFRKFPVAKNSMDKRGGYQDFPSILFCTTTPETLAKELFCVVFRKTSGSE